MLKCGESRTRGAKMSEPCDSSAATRSTVNVLHFRDAKRSRRHTCKQLSEIRRAVAEFALRRRWCGHRDLNSDGVIHTPLKRTRLPVPPWPHSENSILLPRLFVNGFGTKCQEICAGNMMWYENRSCPLQRACGVRGGSAVPRLAERRYSRASPLS